ncbi:MAG: DNA cytosine methyltransferase [Pseudonocardiaceae bacterium]
MTDLGVGEDLELRRANPHHRPWKLTDDERAVYRRMSQASREAKLRAVRGEGPAPLHAINEPRFDPLALMPARPRHALRSLSLFSGGGGLDLGFDLAGFDHQASYELLEEAARTLLTNRPAWTVHGGVSGDVTKVNWRQWKGLVDVIHGGPPCQPFSIAGRQRGAHDERDMFPTFVDAVRTIEPRAFVAENVAALGGAKFRPYLQEIVLGPLSGKYRITRLDLRAERFGIPQQRRRMVLVGFRRQTDADRWTPPAATHRPRAVAVDAELPIGTDLPLPRCMGTREALGLPDIGWDAPAPTIRSSLTGPRHTTSILNSVSSRSVWERLQVWPNGVAPTREAARAFVATSGHFRLSVPDVALLQGFPASWPFHGAVYMALGQIGNAVPPPLGYVVASSVAAALI